MNENMPFQQHADTLRHGRTLAVAVLAGLTLAACTTGTTQATTPEVTSTASQEATIAPSRSPQPTQLQATNEPKPPYRSGLAGCAAFSDTNKFRNHEYEVCTAYIGNTATIALQGFYKFGNNTKSYLSDASRHHFETRYWNNPRQTVERTVDSWPKTRSFFGNHVEASLTLVSLSSSLAADQAVLQTQESWQVTQPGGAVLRSEPAHIKDTTMCRGRLPGHILHEWFVVSDQQDPKFNCRAFDVTHNLKP